MIKLLKAAIAKDKRFIAGNERDINPQVVEMVNKAKGRVDAFEAVLDALRGDTCFLRIMAR